ncbi:MAG: filamentous hemagglutinin N-terminal domain-containing protein [Xenococcaceae cyanobacterium MO_167.B27]|nr:filamentous hemagglutinin N-terminal domain-containing protein [Xenococcaceae cyanobacterium MO_167.B27]
MARQLSNYNRNLGLKATTVGISAISTLFSVCGLLLSGNSVVAQIVPDNTLPTNSVTLPNGNLMEIRGGTTAGSNLFHSFEEFSLNQGDTAWFNNALTIDNIITRVTGSSISNIDGLIRANGTANLFLINPNGIVFGENASLNIGGSFLSSTADSLKFSDGSEFSAVNPQAPPLLTVNIPLGLQYGKGNGAIEVQGQGNSLQFNPDFTVNRDNRPVGLQVGSGQTLALVGKNLNLSGGNLTAEAGNIELGSVGDNSLVKLTPTSLGWSLDYTEASSFQNINLAQAASLDVSGNRGGNVTLQGKEIIITEGSAILADTLGDRDGGKVQVNASELLVLAGTAVELPFISRISTDVLPGATGNGGDIELNTSSLIVADGAQIVSSSYSSGDTGNITVQADSVELISGSPIASSSGVFTLVFGSGKGGDINFEANNIFVLDGAEAAALTFGAGDGGNLQVNADYIELIGTSPGGLSSIFSTNTEATGDGGNLNINTEYLLVADGGAVQSSVFSSGNGGDLTVKATTVELISGAPGVGASGLFSNVEADATGDAGNLSIEVQSLLVADGAQVAVTTLGIGKGGTLEVEADEIKLIGTSPAGFSSGLFSNVEAQATGSGGEIEIDVAKLQILDGAQIAGLTFGSGTGGSIILKADSIELTGGTANAPSGIFTTVTPQAEGNGGNLTIETGSLKAMNGGQIAVSTAGFGNGGDLNMTANTIELIGGSEFGASGIFGNAIIGTGDGGNVSVDTSDLIIQDRATISTSNFSSSGNAPPGQGTAGNILINANSIQLDTLASEIPSSITAASNNNGGGSISINVDENITLHNSSQIIADTFGNGDGGNIAISAKTIDINSDAEVSANSRGLGQAGNITLTADDTISINQGNITATSVETGGGNIALATDFLFLENNSLISTSVFDSSGGGGNIVIDSGYIIGQDNSDIRANAVFGQGGNIDILTEVILLSIDSDIDASSEFGIDGRVAINNPDSEQQIGVVQLNTEILDSTALITAICPVELQNVLVVTGKGGLGENPSQNLRGQSVWEDLRDFEYQTSSASKNEIIEAKGWVVNERGNIELLTHLPFNQCRK